MSTVQNRLRNLRRALSIVQKIGRYGSRPEMEVLEIRLQSLIERVERGDPDPQPLPFYANGGDSVCRRLGLSPSTVSVRKRRALAHFLRYCQQGQQQGRRVPGPVILAVIWAFTGRKRADDSRIVREICKELGISWQGLYAQVNPTGSAANTDRIHPIARPMNRHPKSSP